MTLDIAFKEWAAVCLAIGAGAQSIIFRKGGIAEGNGVFKPEHSRFWLYPTYFHEDKSPLLKPEAKAWLDRAEASRPKPGTILISTFVDILEVQFLTNLDAVFAFDTQHIWTADAIQQRFHYRTPGLWLLKLRTSNLPVPIVIDERVEYAGCKTWVKLKRALSLGDSP